MRVLVACESSGTVRRAFAERGHHAYSCDLLPPDDGDWDHHFQRDVIELLTPDWQWDLMVAHPPCTHLAVSGARWFKTKQVQQRQAIWFFLEFARAPIPQICIENPVGIMSKLWKKPDQIIQPWQFGHPESKKTCLWLKNLPKLQPTNVLVLPARGVWDNQTPSGQNRLGPSPDRWKIRSKTYEGIAGAMAEQWG
jgi:hypothetical protein